MNTGKNGILSWSENAPALYVDKKAKQSGITLISRAIDKHFLVLNGVENIEFDEVVGDVTADRK
jgi:hypothetical protein